MALLSAPFDVDRDLDDLRFVLESRGEERRRIGGKVLGDGGPGGLLPVGGARVVAERDGVPTGDEAISAGDGSVVVEVAPGVYRLRIRALGYLELLTGEADVTTISREGQAFILTLEVVPGTFTVGGVVGDGVGPLGGVAVTLQLAADGSPVGEAVTPTDGTFAFLAVPAGTYRIQLSKLGYRPTSVPDFVLTEDQRFTLTMTPEVIDTFRFVVQADIHIYRSGGIPDGGLRGLIRATIEYVRPSFVLFAGDMTSGTGDSPTDEASVNYYWDSFFSAIAGYAAANIRYFPTRGNHDYYNDAQRTVYRERWGGHTVPGVSLVGDPAAYYSFDFGNSHFTVLAGNDSSLGETEVDWLRDDLAGASRAAHRFVLSHYPVRSEMLDPHGDLSGETSDGVDLETVLGEGGVTSFHCGHEHIFVDRPDAFHGVRQVISGTVQGLYNYPLADGSEQELVSSMVVVDVAGDTVSIHGVRDAPRFTTTWTGATIPPPPPRPLAAAPPPAADILVVDGWQRGRLDERAGLAANGLAMFDGQPAPGGGTRTAAVVGQAAVASGVVTLDGYEVVVYLLSNEGSDDLTFSPLEQELVGAYVSGGGKLVVSASEAGYELVGEAGGPAFFRDVLHAGYLDDDAGTGSVGGSAGTPFAGLAGQFDESAAPFRYPDVIEPAGGAGTLMTYATGDVAAVGWRSGAGGVVYFAFAIDGLDAAADRRALAAAALAYLDR